ncbi:MAG: hypothetical protein ACRDOE_01675 [Streptosporangiaceae bacterium]
MPLAGVDVAGAAGGAAYVAAAQQGAGGGGVLLGTAGNQSLRGIVTRLIAVTELSI